MSPEVLAYTWVHALGAFCAFSIALIILLSRTDSQIHRSYARMLVPLGGWAFCHFMVGLQSSLAGSLFWIRMVLCVACLSTVAMFHFGLAFADAVAKHKKLLWAAYLASFSVVFIAAADGFVEEVPRSVRYPFLNFPHASGLGLLFIVLSSVLALWGLWVIVSAVRRGGGPPKTPMRALLWLGLCGWVGGLSTWLYFYDVPAAVPIAGTFCAVSYLLFSPYLIFRHDLLGLNVIFKKTFVYTLLTLFVTITYALSIVVWEREFQQFVGYSSLLGSLLGAAFIALLFNPLRDLLDWLVSKVLFGKDIVELSTENLCMREELLKQDRMKSVAVFAAGMAHEIKNPITAIKVFAEYLPKKYEDPEFRSKFARIVRQEAERISGIVEDLLVFSKPSEPRKKVCDAGRLLKDIADLLSGDLLGKKISVDFDLDPAAGPIYADPEQVKQAFLNVMMNGLEAMRDVEGRLTLETRRSGKFVRVRIRDNGCGISKRKMPHLFDPFFTDKEEGTGLGLAITHSIVRNNGGRVSVESEEGKGTCFTLELPSP